MKQKILCVVSSNGHCAHFTSGLRACGEGILEDLVRVSPLCRAHRRPK